MTAPLVIYVVGNPSRGDDAIGPLLCARLADWLDHAGLAGQVDLVEDFQLNIEHVLDLPGRQLALFIDAGERTPAPFTFRRIAAVPGLAHSTHALPPESVLQVYRQTEGCDAPPAFVLCVRGEQFELGAALSVAAESHVDAAFELLQKLCLRQELEFWAGLEGPAAAPVFAEFATSTAGIA
ncbi:homospermidine synthase [Dechloromonas denitrificans]|uniref:Homospermidine synthase n=1 Tax=Dechloromonas denitrificans TaxID=281362 RepID=A0A133XIZ1_9RHOO|nr:hydrogenase maturation protease [Dechloromonas denitrificans]KXB30898.1 homospermidine synthase [Dechloromonas denitrificans]